MMRWNLTSISNINYSSLTIFNSLGVSSTSTSLFATSIYGIAKMESMGQLFGVTTASYQTEVTEDAVSENAAGIHTKWRSPSQVQVAGFHFGAFGDCCS